MSDVNFFLPCRKGSVRVPNKNTKPFYDYENGLIERKLDQLCDVDCDRIVVSTDDPFVMQIAQRFTRRDSRVVLMERPPEFAISADLDAFVGHVAEIMPPGVVAWTHVTSPFFGAVEYCNALRAYDVKVRRGNYDSLMAVTPVRNFVWRSGECISHDRSQTKWPQSQDLEPFWEVNSALFMIEREYMRGLVDRIGPHPFLFETEKVASFDIDWPEDFQLAELIASAIDR